MKLIHVKMLAELLRSFGHYQCHLQGLIADNLEADTLGEDIPHNGEEFKQLSHTYHNKIEKIIKDIELMEEPEDGRD